MKKIAKNIQVFPSVWDKFLKSIERRKAKEGLPSLSISSVFTELMKQHTENWK